MKTTSHCDTDPSFMNVVNERERQNESRCDNCDKVRTLNDANLCHECSRSEMDNVSCVECGKEQEVCTCEGGPWLPGGYRL